MLHGLHWIASSSLTQSCFGSECYPAACLRLCLLNLIWSFLLLITSHCFFCCLQPLEAASPVLLNPALNPKKPLIIELINKVRLSLRSCIMLNTARSANLRWSSACLQLKSVLMAIYFAGDHVVWASQAGLYTDKEGTEKYAPLPNGPRMTRSVMRFHTNLALCTAAQTNICPNRIHKTLASFTIQSDNLL